MKSVITVCALSLLLTACRHFDPERRSTEAQIRQHIAGEWTLSDKTDGSWYPTMILATDGTIRVGRPGAQALLGAWEYRDRMLKITPTRGIIEAARKSGVPLNEWDYYPVDYADAHELVMAPGISVAGRLRFTK